MTVQEIVPADVPSAEWVPQQAGLDHNRVPPSFAYKARELLRQRALTPDHPRWRPTTKLGAYALLDQLGIAHAKVRGIVHGLDLLTAEHLAEPVLIKPIHSSNSAGVMLLEPDNGKWTNRLTGKRLTFDQIVGRLRRAADRRGFPDLWMLEEPLSPAGGGQPVPDDVKVYTFQGENALILQRRDWDGARRFRWYDPAWRPVDTGKHEEKVDHTLEPPAQQEEILDLARRISRAFPLAFCRADMYVTGQGVRVGELNGWVGDYDLFDDRTDQRLGAMWEAAEVRVPHLRPIPAAVTGGSYPERRWWRRRRVG